MATDKSSCLATASPRDFARCTYLTADGRRCRMLCSENHPHLCPFHAREEQQLLESRRLGAELSATLTGRFMTAADINFVLGKLFTALAQNRIPRCNAATLAHIAQLMLHSLPGIQSDFRFKYTTDAWKRMLAEATDLSDSGSNPSRIPSSTETPPDDADSE